MPGGKILCVGLVCVDIIQVCKSFPLEDSDQRCLESWWQRGGNASNNCTILSQIGAECEFLGTAADNNIFWTFTKEDFGKHKIEIQHCVTYDSCDFPLSVVVINAMNGSRTIMHSNRNLPELTIGDFEKINISAYSWIHFEGRNVNNIEKMMKLVRKRDSKVTISIEFEKPKENQLSLIPLADVIFIGKDFALGMSWNSMEEAIKAVSQLADSRCIIVCAWGEIGAALWKDNRLIRSTSFPPCQIIDTLGAGDTFCAAMIHCLNSSWKEDAALEAACRLAGAKIGQKGYAGLGYEFDKIKTQTMK